MARCVSRAVVVACLGVLSACGNGSTPNPSPPGGGVGETITGRERIGWDQQAASPAELATFRYAIYVDGVRSEIAEVNCSGTEGAAGFPCSGRLPAMSNGSHVLEIASFVDAGGIVESARSPALRVTVAGLDPGTTPAAVGDGDVLTTADGARLQVDTLFDELREPAAAAVAPDGRVFIGTTAGIITVKDGVAPGPPQAPDGAVLGLALSPAFEHDGYLYTAQVVTSESGARLFRVARYTDFGSHIGARMVVFQGGPAAARPSAALRFGPDGKLYVAFDDGGSVSAAERMSEWSGKVLRLEPDGRTPPDQAAASPVLFRGLTSPRGFDWTLDGSSLWLADASRDGIERLRVLMTTDERPRRVAQRGTFTMPGGLGGAGVTFYRSEAIRAFTGDLFVAGREGGYILRVRFDPQQRGRPVSTERLLEDRVDTVRALAVGPDGAIYFCTDTALMRLVAAGR